MSQSPRRLYLVAVPLIAGCLLGGILGGGVQADADRTESGLWRFGQVLALVEDEYIGDTDSTKLVESAIGGLLSALDPHSNYLDPESFNEMRDEQRGRFHGLGIQITKRAEDKPLTIIAPIDGTPAWRAGLQSGDVIAKIEGRPTLDMTVQQAVKLLKGHKGTKVTITIERPGSSEPFDVTIERDEIPIQSVRVAYMVNADTGVVRIGNFNTTTADELDAAVEKLRQQGMQRLILDLRGNPGGLLEQAVEVSERFIQPGKMVVYTQGRIPGSNQQFVAQEAGNRIDIPLVVLVDGASASASEIVSGAVQDHDRGLIVGEQTFGKGLVQRVIPIQAGEAGALAVTTAKYYTPSGRLIQRDYSDLDDYYLHNDAVGGEDDTIQPPVQDEVPQPEREIFHTSSGREVFGGGGITPDHEVAAERASDTWFSLLRENVPFDFAVRYVSDHPELPRDFRMDDTMWSEFRAFLNGRESKLTVEELESARPELDGRLRANIARIKWGQDAEAQILAESDSQMQRALELFDEATALRERAGMLQNGVREIPSL